MAPQIIGLEGRKEPGHSGHTYRDRIPHGAGTQDRRSLGPANVELNNLD